ncbi:MAG: helix-turn-helix domain-containing protein [Bacteroidales bacterium]
MQYIIGIFIAFFLALLILTKKGRNRADSILGIWMIVIGIHIFGYYSFVSGIVFKYPGLMWLNLPYAFVHGPILYLYTLALTHPDRFKNKKWLLHFVFPLIMVISIIPFMFLPENERIMIYKNEGKGYETFMPDWTILIAISGIFYIIITNILLYQHKKRIVNQFSYQEKINLNWLRVLFYGMLVTWIIIIFVRNDEWIFSISTVFLIFIGYFGIKQAGIFTNQNLDIPEAEPTPQVFAQNATNNAGTEKKKYAKSGLSEDTAKQIHQKLMSVMKDERLFTRPELSLTELANRMEIHPNYLSQVINDLEGVNFYDYINTLRIEEFKKMISQPENQKFTFTALAYDCGFNSKSAFNRFFKKSTHLSPTEYFKNIK